MTPAEEAVVLLRRRCSAVRSPVRSISSRIEVTPERHEITAAAVVTLTRECGLDADDVAGDQRVLKKSSARMGIATRMDAMAEAV